ncbi:peroxidase family protein [Striga asiatica]|uniref:Peroxidase n=1 Tax=Striga asiatica TaxID=4170 RepID=A0A5A7PKW7_STRAF|nr:peroxidase family protein [Striga asiatica]
MEPKICAVIFLLLLIFRAESVSLSYDFYHQSCPQLEHIVRAEVESASVLDPTTPAALLRLMFHDCQVQGCDGSILLDPDERKVKFSETSSSKNFGIRKKELIEVMKSTVEAVCPRKVSCSDIIVLAAQEAVALSGGPTINVRLGRRDSPNPPNLTLVDASLPSADTDVDTMLRIFAAKGMSVQESVAILGAHTLGTTHCVNLKSRLYGRRKDNKAQIPAAAKPGFLNALRVQCPVGPTAQAVGMVQNDLTSVLFDNQYFVGSASGLGVLDIDAQMPVDPRTRPHVETFAVDVATFFRAFTSAFVKLSQSNVLTGDRGVIRESCRTLY